MNALQEKELELLRLFIEVCEELGLTYYLVCGSALGAVKYGGFIPWDDDVDVALPRKDYEVFLGKASEMLPEWVFLQNHRTDRFYPGLGSKLRNSNTTFIEKSAMKIPMHHGIFIDVFPLDGYPSDPEEAKALERVKRREYRKRYVRLVPFLHRDMGLTFNSLLNRLLGAFSDTSVACRKTEIIISAYPTDGCEIWCNHANSMSKKEYAPASWYGGGAVFEFEGLKVKIPSEWHSYLSQKYGDYTQDLPEDEKVPSHGFVVDTERSYLEYLQF